MNGKLRGKMGLAALGLIGAITGGSFGCSSDSGADDGTGGQAQGSGGQSGSYACNEELTGTGGAIGLFACDFWLGEEGDDPLDFSCGQGGQGGQNGSSLPPPALQRVCEAGSEPEFNWTHPVYFCLEELTDDVCGAGHEAAVTACLTQEAPCNQDLDALGCTPFLDECSALDVGTCFWAMTAAQNPGFIQDCFDEPVSGESCDARFMRCAWGL